MISENKDKVNPPSESPNSGPSGFVRKLDAQVQRSPKRTIAIMAGLFIAGIVSIFIRKSHVDQGRSKVINGVTTNIGLPDTVGDGFFSGLMEIKEVLDLEKKFVETLAKDTLTREDSLFILDLNKKLNRMLYEKDKP